MLEPFFYAPAGRRRSGDLQIRFGETGSLEAPGEVGIGFSIMGKEDQMSRINVLSRWLLSACLTLCVLTVISSEIYADITIARKGKAVASILSNGHEKQAQALRKYLRAITGADIPIVLKAPANEQPVIVLNVADSIPGISSTPKGRQGYRIHTDGKRLYLTGRSEMGLTYAVYGFLEDHLGVRFYSRDCEIVPKNESLTVREINDTQEPAFAFR